MRARSDRVGRESRKIFQGRVEKEGVTCAQIVERLDAIGISEKEANVLNKLSRGKFAAAFLLQCPSTLRMVTLRL